jgi:hypothetical protein
VPQATRPIEDVYGGQTRAFSEWRPIDELILKALAHTRASVESMAERLGRSTAEVEAQLHRLGLG